MEHLGIDVHKVESQICILTESGEVVERRIRTQRERFAAVLGERPRARVLIEASTESEWVARCLEELGHEVVVADPNFAAMYATRSRKVKTDLRDARTLAEACKLGAYRAAHRTSDRQRHVRTQLSDAGGAGADESALHLADQCPAAARGPARRERECGEFVRRVAKLALPGQLKSEIAPLLAVFVSVDRQLAWIDTRLEHLARTDETVERLCTAPSVGPVTAAAFSTTVDDPRRFKSAHQWRPIWGSLRAEWSSGEKQSKGHITKGRQQPDAETAGAGRGLDPAPAQPANRGAAEMGHRHRGPAREEDRHRGPGAEDGRSAPCDDARPHLLLAAGITRTGGSTRVTRLTDHQSSPATGLSAANLWRIRKAGERESKSLASVENRAKESAPAHRTPPCAGERASPPRARTEG